MAGKTIVWSDHAKYEFRRILEYYTERNGTPVYSMKLLNQTEELLTTLSKNPLLGRLTTNRQTRVIPFKDYLIFYEVKNKEILILSFWDNRQDEDQLKIK
ncbi:MAG: type II toxin-antitoxin system RelE/ParE family toxin [Saprospirales bacterium]|jgi:addiction module RelE/StbE family toxin|nr:MAG: type II toxin-antitoxin system RelE/ParE family toxin [Saprospirales bacterium]